MLGVTGHSLVKEIGDEWQQQPLARWYPSYSVRLNPTRGMMVLLPPDLSDSSLTRWEWLLSCWVSQGTVC